MTEQRLVPAIALSLGLLFLILFFIVSGPLASSSAESGPLHALSRFFTPGMQADPVQYLTGQVVRIALGLLALSWLAVAAIPRGTADATIRAALRPGFHRRRALLAFVLGAHLLGLGALQLFISHGGIPKWFSEVYAFGLAGFFLTLLPQVLVVLVGIRLLFGRHRGPYDYYLGALAALGSGIVMFADIKSLLRGWSTLPAVDFIFGLVGQVLFSGPAIWAGILLVRAPLPLPGRIAGKSLAAYTVASGIALAIGLGQILKIGSVFRYAPSVAWMDSLAAFAFLVVAAACALHAAAMAMGEQVQMSPVSSAPEIPEPAVSPKLDATPVDTDVPAPGMVRFRPSLRLIVDAVFGFAISGLLMVLAMYGLGELLPMGVIVYMPILGLMMAGGFIVVLIGILIRRLGYALGAGIFLCGLLMLAR
jgi:hypothetical protein